MTFMNHFPVLSGLPVFRSAAVSPITVQGATFRSIAPAVHTNPVVFRSAPAVTTYHTVQQPVFRTVPVHTVPMVKSAPVFHTVQHVELDNDDSAEK